MDSILVESQSSGSIINLSPTELQEIIAQAVRMAGNVSLSIALSVLPSKSQNWLFDSTCCNHMTPYSSLFSKLDPAPHPLNIHIDYGSTTSLGFVSTSNLYVPRVFHIPDLSYNLCSVGKLVELGYRLIFFILGVLCKIQGRGKSLGPVLKLGVCFPWTIFIFYLLLLFLLLLQLLQFLPYHLSHFSILVLVMHHLLGYNS